MIQISIQEDPWNLPSSIRTLVDNIQRYVEGQWVERVSHMSVAFGSEYRLWNGPHYVSLSSCLGRNRAAESFPSECRDLMRPQAVCMAGGALEMGAILTEASCSQEAGILASFLL